MTEKQFAELKALLLMTNGLLIKLFGQGRAQNYPEYWAVVQKNFERILKSLETDSDDIEGLADIRVDYPP